MPSPDITFFLELISSPFFALVAFANAYPDTISQHGGAVYRCGYARERVEPPLTMAVVVKEHGIRLE